ncbi:PadR family transcriptional regulator [Nocardioides endophyticus]|uniref:PadR family transcriptional regulator n=1 Tax=Nocardioides endophyticus TaxID=1353775 RepID=A0ABP8YA60_9ACTN
MSLRNAVLGMLSLRESSGYDIKRHFDRAVHFVWNASNSQIYRELVSMEKDDLVSSRTVQQDGRPNKKVYSLTDTGRNELDRWLTSPAEVPYGKEPFLMRLFFMGRAEPDEAIKVLEDRRAQVLSLLAVAEERLQVFSDPSRTEHPDLLWWQVRLIEGFQRVNTAQLEWIDSLIASVKADAGDG